MIPLANRSTWNNIAVYLRTTGLTGNDNDVINEWLIAEGNTGSYSDKWKSYLENEGYVQGSLNDVYAKWKEGATPLTDWILDTGFWVDSSSWLDNSTWSDA